jgi:hypothetical protein
MRRRGHAGPTINHTPLPIKPASIFLTILAERNSVARTSRVQILPQLIQWSGFKLLIRPDSWLKEKSHK